MNINESDKFIYAKGYIHLPVIIDLGKLPVTIIVKGNELQVKSSFHVSLICVKNFENSKNRILELFNEFKEHNPISFAGFSGEFRFAQRNADNRKSLVAMCTVNNLNLFYQLLRDELLLDIDNQATHVSLYTVNLDEAIGINNKNDLDQMTELIASEIVDELRLLLPTVTNCAKRGL